MTTPLHALAFVLLALGTAQGDGSYWNGSEGATGYWSDGNNWIGDVPSVGDVAYINNGGTAIIENQTVESGHGGIGDGGTGSLIVRGKSTSWTFDIWEIGIDGGTGNLTIEDYAIVQGHEICLGGDGIGSLTIRGHGSLELAHIYAGVSEQSSNASITIEDNGVLKGSLVYLGDPGVVTVVIRGQGHWQSDSDLYIAASGGSASLTIMESGSMQNNNVIISDGYGSNGVATVGDNGVWHVINDFYIGESSDALLTLADSSILTIDRKYVQGTYATLEFRLNATRADDAVVSNLAFLTTSEIFIDGGTLNLLALANWQTCAGDMLTFLLIDSATTINGEFAALLFEGNSITLLSTYDASDSASGIYRWDDAVGNHYTLDTQADAGLKYELTINIAAVPEPSTWAMLLGSVGVLAMMRRCRQKVA